MTHVSFGLAPLLARGDTGDQCMVHAAMLGCLCGCYGRVPGCYGYMVVCGASIVAVYHCCPTVVCSSCDMY